MPEISPGQDSGKPGKSGQQHAVALELSAARSVCTDTFFRNFAVEMRSMLSASDECCSNVRGAGFQASLFSKGQPAASAYFLRSV